MKDRYRLVLLDDETLEKLRAYRFTGRGLILFSLLGLAGIVLASVSMVMFTPLRAVVPGYADVERSPQFIRLNQVVAQLEQTVQAQNNYISKVQSLITGRQNAPQNDTIENWEAQGVPLINFNEISEHQKMSRASDSEKQIVPKRFVGENNLNEIYIVPPIKGIVSAGFLKSRKHLGVDILAAKDTPIKSILDGYVILSDWTLETGFSLGIQHENGLISFYKHNSALLKSIGDFVNGGEAIAIIGNSGELTSGPHLHFELWRNGKPINPEDYIDFE